MSDGTKQNGFKLKEDRFRLDVRKNLFTVMKHWKSFPRVAAGASSLKV